MTAQGSTVRRERLQRNFRSTEPRRRGAFVAASPGSEAILEFVDRLNQQILLADGRRLGYAEYGDPQGEPILYFHGWPGSRLEPGAILGSMGQVSARILALDRPGYGLSDFQAGRKLLDWPKDVGQLTNQLGLGRFAVLGVSGGGPYAAVCAAKMAPRISRLILVCAMGPLREGLATRGMDKLNRWMLFLAQTAPQIARILVGFGLERMRHKPERFVSQLEVRLPECDRQVLARPEFRQAMLENFREGIRPGVAGATWDGSLYAQAWGFRLEEITVPAQLWHGEADVVVPTAMAREYTRAIPHCQAHFVPGEGHFSLAVHCAREILG
jgi:pimeloyl-ACP methyl ester carboxylesterase